MIIHQIRLYKYKYANNNSTKHLLSGFCDINYHYYIPTKEGYGGDTYGDITDDVDEINLGFV